MRIVSLGDQAALVYCSDENESLALTVAVKERQAPWLVDVVLAYTSVAVFFDLEQIEFMQVMLWLQEIPTILPTKAVAQRKQQRIPCCYELGLDLERVEEHTGLRFEQIIQLHSQQEYTVYAIGFSPGFPYLGYLPDALAGVPRLETPRVRVEPGSVGITGRQTGIYPEPRPGGWNLIGRTPLELVNVRDQYFPLRAGDRVQFERIDEQEFRKLQGARL